MNLLVIGILGIALVLLLVRRVSKAKAERKPMELVGIIALAASFILIILRRFGV